MSLPVTKFCYTSSTGKEAINEEILRGLENSLGEVNEESKATGKKPVHNGEGGRRRGRKKTL